MKKLSCAAGTGTRAFFLTLPEHSQAYKIQVAAADSNGVLTREQKCKKSLDSWFLGEFSRRGRINWSSPRADKQGLPTSRLSQRGGPLCASSLVEAAADKPSCVSNN